MWVCGCRSVAPSVTAPCRKSFLGWLFVRHPFFGIVPARARNVKGRYVRLGPVGGEQELGVGEWRQARECDAPPMCDLPSLTNKSRNPCLTPCLPSMTCLPCRDIFGEIFVVCMFSACSRDYPLEDVRVEGG